MARLCLESRVNEKQPVLSRARRFVPSETTKPDELDELTHLRACVGVFREAIAYTVLKLNQVVLF